MQVFIIFNKQVAEMKKLFFILLLSLFISLPAHAASTEEIPDYFYVDKKPLPPRCLWALSLDTADLNHPISTTLSDCIDAPEQLEKFGHVVKQGAGIIGNFVTYSGSPETNQGFLFYKKIGELAEKNVLLIKTTTDNLNYSSLIGTFYIEGDTLYYSGIVGIPFSTKKGIEDARMDKDNIRFSAYASPWELGRIAKMNGYIENEPSKKIFDFTQHGCIGVVYMNNNKITGFFPIEACDTSKPKVPPVTHIENTQNIYLSSPDKFSKDIPAEETNQIPCYLEAIAPHYNKMISESELPAFFASLKKSCNIR